jgi:hypothetical protein
MALAEGYGSSDGQAKFVTGLTTLSRELSGKRLEMLREVLPHVARMGLLWHRTSAIDALTKRETEDAARVLAIP